MGWVIDLDGVVWNGNEGLPGAASAVAALQSMGEQVLFVTNSSYRPVESVEAELNRLGIDAVGRVLSSISAAAELIRPGERVLCCGGPGVKDVIDRRGAIRVTDDSPVDTVLVGIHFDFDYAELTRAMRAIRGGARFIATNEDATFPTERGLLPGNGAIVAAIRTASGVDPIVTGKPHRALCEMVWARLGPTGTVVGDRADIDGVFARALGYRFALVMSGVTSADQLPVEPIPDLIGADLFDVVAQSVAPDPR